MKELEETNCEIWKVTNFKLPPCDQSNYLGLQDEIATTDGSKELNFPLTSGGFLSNSSRLHAWLVHGTRLVIVDAEHGNCISCWSFSNKITSVTPFPSRPGQAPLLLVGLDNNAIRIKDSVGHLCIYEYCTSRVLSTIELPAGVEKACVIHGGADWEEFSEKRPDAVLSGNTGLIFVALRNLQHIVIDINRLQWINSNLDGNEIAAKLEFETCIHSRDTPSSKIKKEPLHRAYELMEEEIEQFMGFDRDDFESTPLYNESLCTALLSSSKIGCLISGCLGRVILWQTNGSIGWISPLFDENASVTHIALLEPSDDPRPFYYLWIACQNDAPDSAAVLRMYALFFNEKRSDKSGECSLYYSLESEPSLKFELELEQGERVHSLQAIERPVRDSADVSSRRGEDSLLLIGTSERLLVFDLNRWYKEQMPRTIAECRNPNSVMASYRTRQDDDVPLKPVVACCYKQKSLREFPKWPNSPEELFYPNSLSLSWYELSEDGTAYWMARGVQAELLREITIAGTIVLVKPTETYRRCLLASLVPFDSSPQDYRFEADKSQQREMLLNLILEQRWTKLLIMCVTEWSDGSAAYLYPEFLRWGVQRASELKFITDRLCVPLFDQSGANIGEPELKTLRLCWQQLECLAEVVSSLPNLESDLDKHRRALKRIATYLQVLLWFYEVKLLPESQEEEDDDMPQMTLTKKIPYPREKLTELYQRKRRNNKNEEGKVEQTLFIDELLCRESPALKLQWEKETGDEYSNPGGLYPPPSLQSLLRSFLTDCHRYDLPENSESDDEYGLPETVIKHSIAIYVLMDIASLMQNWHPDVDRLIKYPSAFKLSPSIIKITQAFWMLDHDDYHGFYEIIAGQLIRPSDIKDWHHKLAVNTLLKNDQHKLALTYLRVLKPPLSSLEEQGLVIELTVEQGMVEAAFHSRPPSHYAQLLTRFFQACKNNGKLAEVLQLSLNPEEEQAFVKFLKEANCDDARLLYYMQRCRHTEATDMAVCNRSPSSRYRNASAKIHPLSQKMLGAFNATLPEITKIFANLKSIANFSKPQYSNHSLSSGYPRPMSQCRPDAQQIYDVALSKTRETCLKTSQDRNPVINHIPFLTAPCATIPLCTRIGSQPEPVDGNGVVFPKRKAKRKRSNDMRGEVGEDDQDGGGDSKRRKLGDEMDSNTSSGGIEAPLTRRLSMSQVCETPLVQRKIRPINDKDIDGVPAETPHSILKIRQMLRRNSGSPSYSFSNGSNDRSRLPAAGDARPMRQIRFSVERFSGNDDDILSTNDLSNDQNDRESLSSATSSKIAEEESCAEENYYSPNVSAKSFRDSSILSDSSMTKCIRGPRPRPGLRRSSLISQASSDYISHKNTSSDNTTLNVSALDTSFETSKKTSNFSNTSPRKSMVSSIYAESILSPNTSIEGSPMKRFHGFGMNKLSNESKRDNDESEESAGDSEHEKEEMGTNDLGVDKDSSIEPSLSKSTEIREEEELEEGELREGDEEVEEQAEEEEEGNDEEREQVEEMNREEMEIQDEEEKQEECQDVQTESTEHDDTFQSFSNSINDTATAEMTESCIRQLDEDIEQEENYSSSTTTTVTREVHNAHSVSVQRYERSEDYNLTNKFERKSMQEIQTSFNYSFTKPIFLDNRGFLRCDESQIVITDDESNDAVNVEIENPELELSQSHEEEEDMEDEAELTLNLSASDGSDVDKKKKDKEKLQVERSSEDQISEDEGVKNYDTELVYEMRSKLADSPRDSRVTKRDPITPVPKKESSVGPRSRLSSVSSTNSEDQATPLRRSTRKQTSVSPRETTPRRTSRTAVKSRTIPIKEQDDTPKITVEPSSLSEEEQAEVSQEKALPERPSRTLQKDKSPTSVADKLTNKRLTRAGSVTVEEKVVAKPTKKTRAASALPRRATRAASITKESIIVENVDEKPIKRSTRASSMAKDSTVASEKAPTKRSTRAASQSKDVSASEETDETLSKRATRASSLAKESSNVAEHDETLNKRPTRRRGGSVPKDVVVETSKTQSRGRRSISLLKEVIPEESFATVDSPAGRRNKLPRVSDEAVSSPAANTRSRRSSIQSVPEELEDILSVPPTTRAVSKKSNKGDARGRRAASVDSSVIVPAGKRMTRSVLAKTIIEAIPEEATPAKKQPGRKRTTSVTSESANEPKKEETIKAAGRPKRGRKASESKDFVFSSPEEAGQPLDTVSEVGSPTFKFSKPHGLQKFILAECDDISSDGKDSVPMTSAKNLRPTRSRFVLPQKAKKS